MLPTHAQNAVELSARLIIDKAMASNTAGANLMNALPIKRLKYLAMPRLCIPFINTFYNTYNI
jgi:hypothetical protein